jgi:hypothetical protein
MIQIPLRFSLLAYEYMDRLLYSRMVGHIPYLPVSPSSPSYAPPSLQFRRPCHLTTRALHGKAVRRTSAADVGHLKQQARHRFASPSAVSCVSSDATPKGGDHDSGPGRRRLREVWAGARTGTLHVRCDGRMWTPPRCAITWRDVRPLPCVADGYCISNSDPVQSE